MAKRVLIFSLAYHPVEGGAEIAIKEITNRVNDIEFDLVTLRFDKAYLAKERVGNVNVYRIGGSLGYLSKILFPVQAALFAARRRYDLYWSMMTYMLFPAVLLRLSGDKTPYVLTLQDGDPFEHVFERWFIRPFRPLLSYGFAHASKIQCISNFLASWAREAGAKGEILVIPNGVPIERFANKHARPLGTTLITTSRLVAKNAVGDIIDALTFLPYEFSLKILGIGPLDGELKEKVRNQNLSGRVEFLGHVPYEEIPQHLHSADIFIRPSLSEGMGSSFIEAMAAGLPVIATPVGGITDFLKDGETGLFCKVNDPEDIAKQVTKLVSDPVLTERLKENALKMVKEKYDWDLIVEQMKSRVFDI
jgi:glycosyltransferase involved in cell wall biosynthesis